MKQEPGPTELTSEDVSALLRATFYARGNLKTIYRLCDEADGMGVDTQQLRAQTDLDAEKISAVADKLLVLREALQEEAGD